MTEPHRESTAVRGLARHPYAATLVLTLAWHAVILVLATIIPFPSSQVARDLRGAGVNIAAALLPLAIVLRWGWWGETGLSRGPEPRSGVYLLPLIGVAVLPALSGLQGTLALFLSTAAVQLCLGFNEELLSRGVVQAATACLGPTRCALWVGLLFGMGHWFNALFFGAPLFDTAGQFLTSTASGFCFAAARFHVLSLWPFIVLHAVENFLRDRSVELLPVWVEVVVLVFFVFYGLWLLRRLPPAPESTRRIGIPQPSAPGRPLPDGVDGSWHSHLPEAVGALRKVLDPDGVGIAIADARLSSAPRRCYLFGLVGRRRVCVLLTTVCSGPQATSTWPRLVSSAPLGLQ